MSLLTANDFAAALGITPRGAREAFQNAMAGKLWRGERLSVVQLSAKRGGKGGMDAVPWNGVAGADRHRDARRGPA